MSARRIVNRVPDRAPAILLGALPFVLLLAAYLAGSAVRLAENPDDKLLPTLTTIGETVERLATTENVRTGEVVLWSDTGASLLRLVQGVVVAALAGFALGIAIGLIPIVNATLAPFVAVASMIPPLSLLPILFIVFGLGELSKVMLIVVGIAPFLIRELAGRTEELPHEQLVKAQTLGASTWQIAVRIVAPQMLPRLFGGLRLAMGPAWLFLIAAEAISAQEGLGYRIFLVRRYLAMDVILPYVAWITLLAFVFDWLLSRLTIRLFPWVRA